jgi:hypothetical protein
MVPLEDVLKKPGSDRVPGFVFRKLKPREEAAPEPARPYEFKVVDLMSRRVLADGVDARAAIRTLEDVRSIVDVNIFVWEPASERWRLLTFGESRMLWERRGRLTEPVEA